MLPVVDLKDFPNESEKMVNACKEWGSFRIVNHGIPSALLSDMKCVIRSLFELPVEIKRRNTDVILSSGYRAPDKINPFYEALGLYDMGSCEAVEDFCNQLSATPQQRETIMSYSKAMHNLVMDVWCKLAESMGVESDPRKGWKCQFRINKYHFTEEVIGTTGVQIHTDSGFLTILQEDESVGGLEVLPNSGSSSSSFVPIDPLPGSLLVNLGDMATIWSNGALYNVKHRVQCKKAAIRISIALFLLGPKEAVETPPQFIDDVHPRLYVPISYDDVRLLRSSTKNHAGEALDLLRLKP